MGLGQKPWWSALQKWAIIIIRIVEIIISMEHE